MDLDAPLQAQDNVGTAAYLSNSGMTLSQVHFLQQLTTLLRQEDHADSGSVSSASSAPSSADEEEFADVSSDLPPFFLGVPILREK